MINQKITFKEAPLLALFLLWLISCSIAFFALGDVPLRDFDEGTVARVSFELSQKLGTNKLLPTIWGEPYLNKPPGLHWIIAGFINFADKFIKSKTLPSEFVIRFTPALLSTFVVPLGGLLQWRLRPKDTTSCLTTSGILLTLLPIARHGRLAMLDGTLVSSICLLWLLFSSIESRKANKLNFFFAGIVSSFLLLLKAPLLIPIGLSALIPMLITYKKWKFSWFQWFSVGILPGISWHIWNSFHRGAGALWLWWGDGLGRVLFKVSSGSGQRFVVPLIETLEGGWPWLLFFPLGIYIAYKERNKISGRWYISTLVIMSLAIVPLKTQYPWYIHPLWLPFALITGPALTSIIKYREVTYSSDILIRPIKFILLILSLFLIVIGLLSKLKIIVGFEIYEIISLVTGTFWFIAGIFIFDKRLGKRKLSAISLFTGNLIGLFILMGSNFWLWELNESWAVQPVADMINKANASNVKMYGSYSRPSLNWYTSQKIQVVNEVNPKGWNLISNQKISKDLVNLNKCKVKDTNKEWQLIYCEQEVK